MPAAIESLKLALSRDSKEVFKVVRVKPFRAFRYDESKVGDLSKVVTPPYDIIKGAKVDELQGLSEHNIAWIIKNKPRDDDTPESNQYTRARDFLNKWVDDDSLKQDEKESFYVYGQDFEVEGKNLFRFGFIGLIELEEFASEAPSSGKFTGVLQHEETLPKDIVDRLSLCRSSMANFGQIFVIYPDKEGSVDSILEKNMKKNPVADITDSAGVRHRIWAVDDESDVRAVSANMDDKYIIIADGHHRYKTALALSKDNPDLESAKYRMLTFVNISNPGLVVLPTHRLVQNLEVFSKDKLLNDIKEYFDLESFENKEEMFNRMNKMFTQNKHSFGLFMDDGKYYSLTLRDLKIMGSLLADKSPELQSLDVAILHALVLDKMLGIDKEKLLQGTMKGGGFVSYIKGIGDAVDESINTVKASAQAVFFMNPTRIEEVEAVSKNFESMPQKSTFFHPKIWTGFTINKLR
ncbi:MAG: DUF1015 domain-containing protein [Candidatus Thorarchaeota archaeon]|nr:DUF1015 domain-containing protein [Candidatus Thorarchaeota archaeon]